MIHSPFFSLVARVFHIALDGYQVADPKLRGVIDRLECYVSIQRDFNTLGTLQNQKLMKFIKVLHQGGIIPCTKLAGDQVPGRQFCGKGPDSHTRKWVDSETES